MGTCAFPGEQPGVSCLIGGIFIYYIITFTITHLLLQDLPFDVYEEMHIINPLPVSLHIETRCYVDSGPCSGSVLVYGTKD